jgi:hypothetical protein
MIVRLLAVVLVIAAIVVVVLATGWADDKAARGAAGG